MLAAAFLVCGSAGAAMSQDTLAVWVVGVNGKGRTNLTADDPVALATSPSVSPNGRMIAYVHSDGRVWLMGSDGTDKRPLGFESGELELALGPTWSPNGRDLAYTLLRLVPGAECASWSVVVRDAGTGALVGSYENALSPSWSPRSGRIAFESNTAHCEQPGALAVATLGSVMHGLRVKLGVTTPAWSPDGRRIAFYCWPPSDRPALCIVDADGQHLRRLATNVPEDLDPIAPAWSPDAKKIAFTIPRGKTRIVPVSNGRAHTLGMGVAPSWSPSGRSIVTYSRGSLKLWDARTGKGHAVTGVDGPFQLVPPAWSGDGKRFYFTSSGS